jgi:hypothetical protein
MRKKKNLSPREEMELREKEAEKKRAARKRNNSIAALMGAMFSFVFVGTVLVLLLKIRLAMNERDNQPVIEPYRGPAIAVTELTSSEDDSKPAETSAEEQTEAPASEKADITGTNADTTARKTGGHEDANIEGWKQGRRSKALAGNNGSEQYQGRRPCKGSRR